MQSKPQTAYDPLESIHTCLPERIPIMPVTSTVVFPTGAAGLQVSFPPNIEVLGLQRDRSLVTALVTIESDDDSIDPASLERVGVLTRVLNRLYLPAGLIQATVQGIIRLHLDHVRFEHGYYSAFPRLVEEVPVSKGEAKRLIELILTTLGGISARVERLADVPRILRRNIGDPGRFADLVATLAHFEAREKDAVLQRLDVADRLRYVLEVLEGEWERVRAIEPSRPAEEEEGQRKGGSGSAASIRKRIAVLQAELGEIDPAERETIETLRRIESAGLPSRVASVARREAERLRDVAPSAAEAGEIHSYVDALLELPWRRTSENDVIDLEAVAAALDAEHLGLEEVKRRILEILSVDLLRGSVAGLVPCIAGPPGVGKRSLAAAVARGLGRPLVRVDLGGRGETQLVGGRRGRAGAQPGKLIAAYREAGLRDPVFLLAEMDEVGLGNPEGDPVEAMEDFLDPTTRKGFVDRYLDVPFDLSDTIFIATANDFHRVPRTLRDQLIEIRIAGYTPEEKVEIARKLMLPRLVATHGLTDGDVSMNEDVLAFITQGYARDSGLGGLRRALSAILRSIALGKARGQDSGGDLDRDAVQEVLGIPRYSATEAEKSPEIGVVTGLAWTAAGGQLMFIEALRMPGSGRLITTGLLGEVMRESVSAAYSYVRSRADSLGISQETFADSDVHVHFPVGATPKDGPSAGAAVTLALASSLAERPVRHDIAMTGEVTLRGRILEIGGVKEKILAANRAGLREVILPRGNEADLRDVPDDVRQDLTFHLVDRMEEVFELCLLDRSRRRQSRGSARKRAGTNTPRATAND